MYLHNLSSFCQRKPLILRQLTSASAFSGGLSSAVQKVGSRLILFLMSLRRFRHTSISPMPMFTILRRWMISPTNPMPTTSSTEGTLIWTDCIKSISLVLTLSSVRKAGFSIRSLMVKTLSRVLTGLSAIRLSNLPGINPKRNTLEDFAELYNTPKNSSARLYILPMHFISAQKILQCFTKSVGRWSCFFKWIKQHLYIKSFWGNSENAVRIQIYCAISAYCLVAIAEHDYHHNRSMFDVLRILRGSLIDRTPIRELFERAVDEGPQICDDVGIQLSLNF